MNHEGVHMKLDPVELSFKVTVEPEHVEQFDNLPFEVTPKHMEYLTETLESIIDQNYYDDLFEALLVADERIKEDSV
jgi:hypothetical protein